PNTYVGLVAVGDMPADLAAKKLREWWQLEKLRDLDFTLAEKPEARMTQSLSKLGVVLDDQASISQVPVLGFWDNLKLRASGEAEKKTYEMRFVQNGGSFDGLRKFVDSNTLKPAPARVRFVSGKFLREPEQIGQQLDDAKLGGILLEAMKSGTPVVLPLKEKPKRVPDEKLAAIDEVMSEFTTTFSAGNVSRSSNIRLAASKIDGVVLAPGEKFSFNGIVGRRTAKSGFKEAGVYRNGRHDIDVGGGICQVSTTLYNAALLANLKIVTRNNHSMPVPYVPLGRDATVDYDSQDFVFQNSLDRPVAISAAAGKSSITFRVLADQKSDVEVKIEASGRKSWATGQKQIQDPNLPAGRTVVIEKGSSGHEIYTHRVVLKDGVEVAREPLGRSHYRGGTRIVAVGTRAIPKPAAADENVPEAPPQDIEP
ncbi:MAG TPA: VanW family protein, partial [Fimbriimonadaceae bacterium]|nr:VanW family protein [Fimbriimonadaceae bacterium]